jgi:hypothetical protein
VKQSDIVGRPDIDTFEAVMVRENRQREFAVGFVPRRRQRVRGVSPAH